MATEKRPEVSLIYKDDRCSEYWTGDSCQPFIRPKGWTEIRPRLGCERFPNEECIQFQNQECLAFSPGGAKPCCEQFGLKYEAPANKKAKRRVPCE